MHVNDLAAATLSKPSIVTIGVFDGLHLGHQALIRRLLAEAQANGLQSVVLTFYPHPDVVLRGIQGRYYLMTPEQRAELLLQWGVDWVVTQAFDDSVRQIRAAAFVDKLLTHLQMAALWVGPDFALGYQREGNVAFLREQGMAKGFSVQTLDLVMQANQDMAISSSAIRQRLGVGDVAQVREWLGRGYTVRGLVEHGDKRGRTIGFPTANLGVWPEQIIPARGVYAGWATLAGERFMAVTNVGVRPTFEGEPVLKVEAHLLDFDREIYGHTLDLTFEARLRAEQKFNGIDALKAQLAQDVQAGRVALAALAPDV